MNVPAPATYDLSSAVATISLNRPERLNALTADLLGLLRELLAAAVADGARAVLLRGEGRAFCAGADLGGGSVGPDTDFEQLLVDHYNPVATALAELPIPVVSAIQGAAAGAGVSLALAGDIVLAARSSYLMLAFANIGLVPDAGATWLVAKSAGRARTLAMALLGERMSAEEALQAGLVTRIVADEALDREARAVAEQLAEKPTVALGLIRAQVGAALGSTLAETLALEARNQGRAARTRDFAEGVDAFLKKRPARFEGC